MLLVMLYPDDRGLSPPAGLCHQVTLGCHHNPLWENEENVSFFSICLLNFNFLFIYLTLLCLRFKAFKLNILDHGWFKFVWGTLLLFSSSLQIKRIRNADHISLNLGYEWFSIVVVPACHQANCVMHHQLGRAGSACWFSLSALSSVLLSFNTKG